MNMMQELMIRMSFWVNYFTEDAGEDYPTGKCHDIAESLIGAMVDLGWVWDEFHEGSWENWSAYESFTVVYTPTDCPWKVPHHMVVFTAPDGNYVVDIPMKEYVRFNKETKRWIVLDRPTMNVHVIKTPEEFMAAYPGMTKEEAKEQADMLQGEEYQFITADALRALSGGRYGKSEEVMEYEALEEAGQIRLIEEEEKMEETTTVNINDEAPPAEEETRKPMTVRLVVETLEKWQRNPKAIHAILSRATKLIEESKVDNQVKMTVKGRLPTLCHKCSGTGIYSQNRGVCYACIGKGYQDREDWKRNLTYWSIHAH